MTRRTLTRVSTLAKVLDDASSLFGWKQEMALRGIAKSPDLQAILATLDPDNGAKEPWRALARQAEERAAVGAAANLGTAIHSAVEIAVNGGGLDRLPDSIRVDAEAVLRALDEHELTVLGSEMFVVNQLLSEPLGGSFDHLVEGSRGGYVLDIKTVTAASSAKYGRLSWATQIATYARSRPFVGDVARDGYTRPVIDDIPENYADWPVQPSTEVGIVACVVRGSGQCDLYAVDLEDGWEAAQLAIAVRAVRNRRVFI